MTAASTDAKLPAGDIFHFEAIGTHWWIEDLANRALNNQTKQVVLAEASRFDVAYSRFIDDSLVGRLNRGERITGPTDELLRMFAFARQMHDASGGAFDITVGGVLHGLGYGSRQRAGRVETNFWRRAHIDDDYVQLPPGAVIDFGGFGKGWLIDRFADTVRAEGIAQFIVNGGGDLYVQSTQPIEIALEHPTNARLSVGSTRITTGALGVSSPYKRTWTHDGAAQHHLIDPVTSRPSTSDVASSYVRADTALTADAMATILLLRPELEAALSHRFGLRTILLRQDQL
ncbi:MAG TPA: FAD:protein FMN transferase [Candidatus Saccharimonadales bacterium]|jgi:thiamine biosynthesis lipoprotein